MKSESLEIDVQIIEESYQEHPYTPNRRDNYVPNKLIISNTDFSRVEQRLFEFFVNQINHGTIDTKHGIQVRIPIKKISEYVTPRQVMAVTKAMAQKIITLVDLAKPNLEFKHIPVFTSIEYNIDNSGVIEFRSNAKLSPYLANLGTQYTRYDFKTIQSFHSTYSTLMYKILKMHLGQNRISFVYSIKELKSLLQIEKGKYENLKNFKVKVLDIVRRECANAVNRIDFDYEHFGNRQRNVTHLKFNITTIWNLVNQEKEDFKNAILVNPGFVLNRLEDILIKNYNFKSSIIQKIMTDKDLNSKFATLHIEFENGIYPKVKNRSAYVLACLGLVKVKK